jgi:RNA polymerase sigma-70 factor (ECF subfamily)
MTTVKNTVSDEVITAVADAHRREWAFVLAATVRVTRDLDLAEECTQDAFAEALTAWTAQEIPARPGGWLTTVARRRALDVLRRQATLRRKLPLLLEPISVDAPGDTATAGTDALNTTPFDNAPDDRLRLVFTCCHPALSLDAQVALTLRLLCGLTTGEVARAFLVSEATMSARITRAKKKISQARIPYRVPPAEELPERVEAVLTVLHLLLTTGHSAPAGQELVRGDLVSRALDLARMLRQLLPTDPEVAGLLALVLYADARRATRCAADGRLLLLSEQDRNRWDRGEIAEATLLVREALRCPSPGRFTLQAAIAAIHAEAPSWSDTDWPQIVVAYDALLARWPTPVVALNRAVAVGMAHGPAAGLELLDVLGGDPALASYSYLPSARADFLRQLGRNAEARTAYEEALLLTDNAVERDFLADRLAHLPT